MLVITALALATPGARADDLGTIGPTYEIAERDLIEVITDKLTRLQQSGELARLQDEYKRGIIDGIERPKPIPGIRATETARTYYIDLTWTLDRDAIDEKGQVLYKAGTRVNPFEYDKMSKTLLFFDGGSPTQVEFAERFISEAGMPVKPILIGGEPLKLMRAWKREVFFDQGGALSRRFAIAQSPAVVSQEGKRLRIDEIRP